MAQFEMEPPSRRSRALAHSRPLPSTQEIAQSVSNEMLSNPRLDRLTIRDYVIGVADLQNDIREFRTQFAAVERIGYHWPCAVIFPPRLEPTEAQPASRLVPLDLTDGSQYPHTANSILIETADGRLLDPSASGVRAEQAGFKVEMIPPSFVIGLLITGIADAVRTRVAAIGVSGTPGGPGYSPPQTPFEVTTNINKQTVLFAKGHFLSTRQGFGQSSPAKRVINHGQYTFGIDKNGTPDFDQTVWAVPQVLSVHLNKP